MIFGGHYQGYTVIFGGHYQGCTVIFGGHYQGCTVIFGGALSGVYCEIYVGALSRMNHVIYVRRGHY